MVLTEKKADIDQFEKYVTALTRMFMGSLEDNQNITETVRTEFDALLKSKDATIQDLQEKLTVAKQLKEEAAVKAKTHADENSRLSNEINNLNNEYNTKINDMQSMLSDKDNLNKALTDSCNDLKAKVESMTEAAEQAERMRRELADLKSEHEKAVKEKADLERQIDHLKQHEEDALERLKEQSQIALDKALLELDKVYQEQMQMLMSEKQAEIDKYQSRYFELLEQMKR